MKYVFSTFWKTSTFDYHVQQKKNRIIFECLGWGTEIRIQNTAISRIYGSVNGIPWEPNWVFSYLTFKNESRITFNM